MNTLSKQLIEQSALFLITDDSRKYQEYLRSPLSTAIDILGAIESSGAPITNKEIATATGISINVVRDTLLALRKGGYPLSVDVAGTTGGKYLVTIGATK